MVERAPFCKVPHIELVRIVERFNLGTQTLLQRLKTDVEDPEKQSELEILREVYLRDVLKILLDGYCNISEASNAIREVFEPIDEFNKALNAVLGSNP